MSTLSDTQLPFRARATFARLFGDPLDLWAFRDGNWQRCPTSSHSHAVREFDSAFTIDERSLPKNPRAIVEPVVAELAPGILRITAPLLLSTETDRPDSGAIVFAGSVRGTTQSLASALVRLAGEQHVMHREVGESRIGLAPHLEQISYDFEELTWLRRLNDQTSYYDITTSVADMARRILPDLCLLIKAESLVFVGSLPEKQGQAPDRVELSDVLVWSGQRVLDDCRMGSLIELVRREAKPNKPLVLNHLETRADFADFPDVRSCVYIPVRHRGSGFGWLLALNRIPWDVRCESARELVPTAFCEDEFGTCEASLMNAAAGALASHAYNAAMFRQKEVLLIGVIRAMINAIDAKDAYTCGHSDRVAIISKLIGIELGLDSRECERLYTAGLLHDLGKIGIPDAILTKPGKLTDDEYAVIRNHPAIGHSILSHLPELDYVLSGVLHHHETVDGKGYPAGYCGDEIPLFGRILAVADAYDAMTSTRPYRTAMPREKAEAILTKGAGTQWDVDVIQAFLRTAPQLERACADAEQHLPSLLGTTGAHASTALEPDPILQAVASTHY